MERIDNLEIVQKEEVLNEKGQGLVEYALILALIVIVCIAVLGLLGQSVNSALSTVNSAVGSGVAAN
jgi:pilus assembly protein Flp/PilA